MNCANCNGTGTIQQMSMTIVGDVPVPIPYNMSCPCCGGTGKT